MEIDSVSSTTTFDQRELDEIQLCMYYRETTAHGTVGHNRMVLIAKLCLLLGFSLDVYHELVAPSVVKLDQNIEIPTDKEEQ